MTDNSVPIRVLIVEDYASDAAYVRMLLGRVREVQFAVEEATDLASAVARLAAGGVDIVLLDLDLPDSRGLETLARVRSQSPEVPVIVLTGFDDQAMGVKAISMGARDYIVKNVVSAEILNRAILRQIERTRQEGSGAA